MSRYFLFPSEKTTDGRFSESVSAFANFYHFGTLFWICSRREHAYYNISKQQSTRKWVSGLFGFVPLCLNFSPKLRQCLSALTKLPSKYKFGYYAFMLFDFWRETPISKLFLWLPILKVRGLGGQPQRELENTQFLSTFTKLMGCPTVLQTPLLCIKPIFFSKKVTLCRKKTA